MTQNPSGAARKVLAPSQRLRTGRSRMIVNKGRLALAAAGVDLAPSAAFNRAAARRTEAANPPAGDFVKVDGVRLHYVGRGPAVRLLLRHDVRPGVVPLRSRRSKRGRPGGRTVSPLSGALLGPAVINASSAPAPSSGNSRISTLARAQAPQIRATAADTAMMVPGALSLSGRSGKLELRVVVMAGRLNRTCRPTFETARGDIAGSELRVPSGRGHLFHYALPEKVAVAIDDVTASLAGE